MCKRTRLALSWDSLVHVERRLHSRLHLFVRHRCNLPLRAQRCSFRCLLCGSGRASSCRRAAQQVSFRLPPLRRASIASAPLFCRAWRLSAAIAPCMPARLSCRGSHRLLRVVLSRFLLLEFLSQARASAGELADLRRSGVPLFAFSVAFWHGSVRQGAVCRKACYERQDLRNRCSRPRSNCRQHPQAVAGCAARLSGSSDGVCVCAGCSFLRSQASVQQSSDMALNLAAAQRQSSSAASFLLASSSTKGSVSRFCDLRLACSLASAV